MKQAYSLVSRRFYQFSQCGAMINDISLAAVCCTIFWLAGSGRLAATLSLDTSIDCRPSARAIVSASHSEHPTSMIGFQVACN